MMFRKQKKRLTAEVLGWFFGGAATLALGYLMIRGYPDLARYLKLRRM